MIEVKGPNVFQGYWRMPEKTAAEFKVDGFFVTGDLGKVDRDGYVHIVGRGKDLIITGGYNVYPKEIETEIDALPGVVESAVIGLGAPGFRRGRHRRGGGGRERAGRGRHPHRAGGAARQVQVPQARALRRRPARNAMGKVQKNVLRETHAGLYAGAAKG